jgi:hypothetical protein
MPPPLPPRRRRFLVLDIDGTLVGNVSYQCALWELSRASRDPSNNSNNSSTNNASPIAWRPTVLHSALRAGLLRPGFARYVKAYRQHLLQTRDADLHLYVYTASVREWAAPLVREIERVAGLVFERPLLTRSNCAVTPRGSICKSMDTVLKTIRRRFGRDVHADHVLMVDNTAEVFDRPGDRGRLLHCPTYDFELIENLPAHVPRSLYDANREAVCAVARTVFGVARADAAHDYDRFQYLFYEAYVRRHHHHHHQHRHHHHRRRRGNNVKDNFFKLLIKGLVANRVDVFTPAAVESLTAYVSRKES